MPRNRMQDPWSTLADILREVSWVLKTTLCLGLLLGIGVAFHLFSDFTRAEVRLAFHFVSFLFIGCTLGGGLVGLGVGVLLETAWQKLRGKGRSVESKKRRTRWRP